MFIQLDKTEHFYLGPVQDEFSKFVGTWQLPFMSKVFLLVDMNLVLLLVKDK